MRRIRTIRFLLASVWKNNNGYYSLVRSESIVRAIQKAARDIENIDIISIQIKEFNWSTMKIRATRKELKSFINNFLDLCQDRIISIRR
jgi:hypothetical protein